MPPLFPPRNFGYVTDGITRSDIPLEVNFEFLSKLDLKTVLLFSTGGESEDRAFQDFLQANPRIRVISLESSLLTEELVLCSLNIITDSANLPVLLTSSAGKNVSGVVVACLRKCQRWSLTSIYEEFRRFAGYGGSRVLQQQEQFIELFDTDLIKIANPPPSSSFTR